MCLCFICCITNRFMFFEKKLCIFLFTYAHKLHKRAYLCAPVWKRVARARVLIDVIYIQIAMQATECIELCEHHIFWCDKGYEYRCVCLIF